MSRKSTLDPLERNDEARMALAEKILGRTFGDRELLRLALTHPSAVENGVEGFYERLEFLGDSVLGFIISEETFRRFPNMREGGMTRIKVSLVAGSVLSAVARDLGLADALILGNVFLASDNEVGTGGRGLRSALENTYEALVAAIYLDAGIDEARQWVLSTLGPLITEDAATLLNNPKAQLQETVQARGQIPVYETLSEEGPPHDRTFTVAVEVDGARLGTGTGRTKREAEAMAAAAALKRVGNPTRKRGRRV